MMITERTVAQEVNTLLNEYSDLELVSTTYSEDGTVTLEYITPYQETFTVIVDKTTKAVAR